MAFTATNNLQSGQRYYVNVRQKFTDTTDLSDEVAADLSAMTGGFTSHLRIDQMVVVASPGISVLVEVNDKQAAYVPLGGLAVIGDWRMRDTGAPQGAGDMTVTTESAAADDGLWIWAEVTVS